MATKVKQPSRISSDSVLAEGEGVDIKTYADTKKSKRITVPFVWAYGGADTLYGTGIRIDAASEQVGLAFTLPDDCSAGWISSIKIYARGLINDADGMQLEIFINAGGPGEAFNIHSQTDTNVTSDQTGIASNMILSWTITSGTALDNVGPGDNINIIVQYESALSGNVPTNCYVRNILVEYS